MALPPPSPGIPVFFLLRRIVVSTIEVVSIFVMFCFIGVVSYRSRLSFNIHHDEAPAHIVRKQILSFKSNNTTISYGRQRPTPVDLLLKYGARTPNYLCRERKTNVLLSAPGTDLKQSCPYLEGIFSLFFPFFYGARYGLPACEPLAPEMRYARDRLLIHTGTCFPLFFVNMLEM